MAKTTVSLSSALSRVCVCVCACAEADSRWEQMTDGACPIWNREWRTWSLGTSELHRESEQQRQAHTPHANRTLHSPWGDSAATRIKMGLENRSQAGFCESRAGQMWKKKSAGTASEAKRQGKCCLDVYLLEHICPSHGPMHTQQEGECERAQLASAGRRGCQEPTGGTLKQQHQDRHDEPESLPTAGSDWPSVLYKLNTNDGRTRPALTSLNRRRCTKKSVGDQWTARTSLH